MVSELGTVLRPGETSNNRTYCSFFLLDCVGENTALMQSNHLCLNSLGFWHCTAPTKRPIRLFLKGHSPCLHQVHLSPKGHDCMKSVRKETHRGRTFHYNFYSGVFVVLTVLIKFKKMQANVDYVSTEQHYCCTIRKSLLFSIYIQQPVLRVLLSQVFFSYLLGWQKLLQSGKMLVW